MGLNELDRKLNDAFPGFVVRKDLVKLVKRNAAVPSYVLEYLLGQNCATDDEAMIDAGVERVRDILAKHYVQRAEAGAVRSDMMSLRKMASTMMASAAPTSILLMMLLTMMVM